MEKDFKVHSHRQLLESPEDKKLDFDMKKKVCLDIETALDRYYVTITDILARAAGVGSQIEFLCKNQNPDDPGLRDVASYSRFHCIEMCSQAEQAECEFELARASLDAKVLLRKLSLNYDGQFERIEYKAVTAADVTREVKNGFVQALDCTPFQRPAYMSKSLPFNPALLKSTCGKAGYGDYVD
jgi:hypothetical protein